MATFAMDDAEQQVTTALADPDRRLGVILHAIVTAHDANPAESLWVWHGGGADVVKHPHWPLPRDVVRMHDLKQLEDLGLVGSSLLPSGLEVWPTPDGRDAVHNAPELLERRSETATSEREATRLRQLAETLRAGDVAVGVVAGTASAVVRALIGF